MADFTVTASIMAAMLHEMTGSWVEAEATIVDAATAAHGYALLRHKYGWMKGFGFPKDAYTTCPNTEDAVQTV